MSRNAAELADLLNTFHIRLLSFIEGLDDAALDTVIPSVGYEVRTIAAQLGGPRCYGITRMISAFLDGDDFPEFDEADLRNAGKARLEARLETHRGWEKDRILDTLRDEGPAAVNRVAALSDEELSRTMSLQKFGNEVSLAQAIDWLVIGASVEMLEEMRRSVFTGSPLV